MARRWLSFTVLSVMLSGCLGTQYLQENQKLLYKQKTSGTRSTGLSEWSNLYVQKTNRKFLGLPAHLLVTMYYTGQKKYDQQKFIDKKAQVEKKFDARIARTTDQRKIGNIQYHKQQKLEELNNKIENGNNFMQWGEPLTVFDSAQTEQTAQRPGRPRLFSGQGHSGSNPGRQTGERELPGYTGSGLSVRHDLVSDCRHCGSKNYF